MNLKSLFSLCNATPQHAVNARRQRQRFIHIFFLREMGKKKKEKKKSCERGKVRKYFFDLLLARVQAQSFSADQTYQYRQDNRQTDSLKAEFTVQVPIASSPQVSHKATINRGSYFLTSNLTRKSTQIIRIDIKSRIQKYNEFARFVAK